MGDLDHAHEAFAAARALARTGPEFNSLCWSEATAGVELDDALGDCDKALADMPDTPAFLDSRGFVLLRLKRYEESITSYDAAIKLQPQEAASLYGRGIAKLRLGRQAGGEADIAAARAVNPRIEAIFGGYGVKR
jgi:tetratricopeptide (TPR) repeat protein